MRFDSALCRRVLLAILYAAALCAPKACFAQEAELQLRLALGGGESVAWKGSISISADAPAAGTIERVTPIGLESDSVRSFLREPSGVRIDCPTARAYEAVDLRIRAPVSANVIVSIGDGNGEPVVMSIPISKLVTGRHTERIDERGNQLTVERTPGDRLRVDIKREHLVFAPGEAWSVSVDPHLLGSSFPTSANLQTRLLKARSSDQLWTDQQPLSIDGSGGVEGSTTVAVPVPNGEGVYDLEFSIVRPRQRALIPTSEVVVRRRVQFVVVSETEPPSEDKGWRESPEYEFDPSQPRFFPRLATVAPRNGLSAGLTPGLNRSLGSRDTQTIDGDERSWVELAGDGWQAYALSLTRPGEPHILEIEYPGDRVQSLGVSLLEPNAAGKVVPVGVDGMIHVESPTDESQRYRLIFWPRTKQPYLVLTNRQKSKPAAYGSFRVFRRDGRLPAITIDKAANDLTAKRRFAVARFNRPIFSKVFGATDVADEESDQALDDWVTFYDGTRRMIEYVRYLGYDAVSITALCEGSAIFPASDVRLNPKYDTGIYFSNGQDPVRKDVLELIFRLCNRSRLKLIPALELTTPFESLDLEKQSMGIRLSDTDSANSGPLTNGASYNPIDPRVQAALARFVEQTTRRYAMHPSFGGLGLTLASGTPTHLPRVDSACDPVTVARFVNEAGLPELRPSGVADHVRMLSDSSYRELWSRWRSHQLGTMYRALARIISASGAGDAKLYLALDNLVSEPAFTSALAPALPNSNSLSKAFMAIGLNLDAYAEDESFVLLRPHRFDLLASVADQGPLQQLNESVGESGRDRINLSRGSSFYHVPQPLRLPELDKQLPFGKDNFTLLTPQAIPSGPASRRHLIQSLASHDTRVWFDGGWTAVRDQHDWLAPIIDIFRRLPADRFETVGASIELGNRFVIRKLSRNGETYAYAVNNTPWPITARIQLGTPTACELKPLSPYKRPGTLKVSNKGVWWECTLQPYDVIAGVLTCNDVTFGRAVFELPENVQPKLRNEIADLSTRISALAKPRQMLLSDNPGFESPGDDPEDVVGWLSTQDSDVQIRVDSVAHSGEASLRIFNRAPVAWLRSTQFGASDTGRMLFRIWARPDVGVPPRLRLLAESTTPGQAFARQIELVMPPESANEWRPYDLWIDDLPVSVKNLRVGVDVLGSGTVWLDDAQAFDLTFSRRERNELSKIMALADLQLREGRIGDCRTSLDQYWMQYLMSYVSPDAARVALAPKNPAKSPGRTTATNPPRSTLPGSKKVGQTQSDEPPQSQPKTTSAFEKLRRLVPGLRR